MKKNYPYFIATFLTVVTFITFARIWGNGFVKIDDTAYIIANYHIQSGISAASIKWAFSAVVLGNWHPITFLSHALDWSLFGANASGHHLISLLLHIGSMLFLFLFLNRTTKNLWLSAFAAALFALHPLRVESVAWAAERKDVLSMFFGLASIYVYASYVENYNFPRYFFCFVLFALSLMSKPMLVTLPFVLLLLDYWPLGRWTKEMSAPVKNRNHLMGRLIWEKGPFILLTILSSIVTLWSQNKGGSVVSADQLSFMTRVANAVISYVSYLGKTVWPVDLAVFYPYEHSVMLSQILAYCLILIFITAVVICAMKKYPFLFVGWFWYLGTLIPVIGLVQVGKQAMADRYTYLPSIGIAIMLVWGVPLLFPREDIRKKILFPGGVAVLAVLAVLTWHQCGYWKSAATLFSRALQVTKNNSLAHNGLGIALFEEQKIDEAIHHYNEGIRLDPRYADIYNNRGLAYAELGQRQRAIEDYNQAIRLKKNFSDGYYNRGNSYSKLGQYQYAIDDYNEAIRIRSDHAESYYNRGVNYSALGKYKQAIKDYSEVIRIKPDYAEAYYDRGVAYGEIGQYQQAINDYHETIRIKSDHFRAYNNNGTIYAKLGHYQQAIEYFDKSIRLKHDYADAYYNRGFAYARLGNDQRAIDDFSEAIRLNPNDAGAYGNRGTVYLEQGNNKIGCKDAKKACELGNCNALKFGKEKGFCRDSI